MKRTKAHTNRIVLIGAGNIATHLGLALKRNGCEILQVYSYTEKNAKQLAAKLNSSFTCNLNEINKEADLYILAVKDDAIKGVIDEINFEPNLIAHTSGTTSLNILQARFSNCAVLYPLQTFSTTKKIDFKEVPFFIEANNQKNFNRISAFASLLSPKIYNASSEKRKGLHVAAVFACNFTNHMYAIANEILKKEKIPFGVLIPLIEETANKIKNSQPQSMQTGPAARNDLNVINAHKKYLEKSIGYKKIYTLVSQSISDLTKKNGAKPKT